MSIDAVSAWLASTPVSAAIREHFWIVPTVQSVHILAICALAASALIVDLRLMSGHGETLSTYVRRYMPWLWNGLIVLAFTGLVMLVGEPDRTLINWVFWLKLSLVSAAVLITVLIQRPLAANAAYWDMAGRRPLAIGLGLASILLWISVIACGRWIAYVM